MPKTKTKKKPSLANTWLSVTDVRATLARSRENRGALSKWVTDLNARTVKALKNAEPSLASFSEHERSTILKRMEGTERAKVKDMSADTRRTIVREAGRISTLMASAKVHYQSPVQMLMRDSIGSERRSRLMEQIAASGPAELASLAALAASTNDKDLGAALCTRLSKMDRAQRLFTAQELADALVGAEWREVNRAILETERLTLETVTEDRAFETGRDQGRQVKIALMKREEEQFAEPQEADDDDPQGDGLEDASDPETQETKEDT